jgi:hypothetical protein
VYGSAKLSPLSGPRSTSRPGPSRSPTPSPASPARASCGKPPSQSRVVRSRYSQIRAEHRRR